MNILFVERLICETVMYRSKSYEEIYQELKIPLRSIKEVIQKLLENKIVEMDRMSKIILSKKMLLVDENNLSFFTPNEMELKEILNLSIDASIGQHNSVTSSVGLDFVKQSNKLIEQGGAIYVSRTFMSPEKKDQVIALLSRLKELLEESQKEERFHSRQHILSKDVFYFGATNYKSIFSRL